MAQAAHENAIRPFHVNVPEAELAELRRRVNPTAHGASASDAFHLVIPSMPGYGFSGKPTTTGWGPERIARAWAELMKRLGDTKYVAQDGDWGALIVHLMGGQATDGNHARAGLAAVREVCGTAFTLP